MQEFNFEAIDSKCVKYIDGIEPEASCDKKILKRTNRQIEKLEKIFNNALSQAESLKTIRKYQFSSSCPIEKQIFFYYCQHLEWKKKRIEELFYTELANVSSQLTTFMKQSRDSKLLPNVRVQELKKDYNLLHDNNPKIKRINMKLEKLVGWEQKRLQFMCVFNANEFREALLKNEQKIDEKTFYLPECEIDDMIYTYVRPYISIIDGYCVRAISKKKARLIDFSEMEKFVQARIDELDAQTENQYYIIRNALLRICFDRFYIFYGQEFSRKDDGKFHQNCQVVLKSTPKQLYMSLKLLTPEMADQTIDEIINENQFLIDAIDLLEQLNFYRSPPDILQCIFLCLKNCEIFVRGNTIGSRKYSVIQTQMSFDEFFPLFFSVYSKLPLPNSQKVKWLLESMYGLKMAIPFDFAKLMFTSTVDFLSDFSFEKLKPEASQIDQ